MASQAAQQDRTNPDNPLDRLSRDLHDDMLKVNKLILENMQSEVALIPQLAGYLIAAGGKRVRPLLTLACTSLFDGDMRRAHGLAGCVEFIHTATLLHDDVVDESAERRGKQTANLVFGNQASVLVGDFLFSRAFQLMVADGALDVLKILSDASATIAQGEVKQLTTAGNLDTTMTDYEQVIAAKTAALFAAACEVGPVIAGADEAARRAMRDYGLYLGMAFQIADDVLDYSADQAALGKTVGDDFREGKMTAPVLLALEQADDEEYAFWTRTIGGRQQTDEDLETALTILQKHGALTHGLAMARNYSDKALAALAPYQKAESKSGALGAALHELVDFTINRAF